MFIRSLFCCSWYIISLKIVEFVFVVFIFRILILFCCVCFSLSASCRFLNSLAIVVGDMSILCIEPLTMEIAC